MSVINSIPLIAAGDDGYQISRSVRLRSSASAYFSRTQASGNNQKFTLSQWVKRGKLGATQYLLTAFNATTDGICFTGSDQLEVFFANGSTYDLITTAVYRDPSAWYHVVVSVDTTQATASNRVQLFVNNVAVSFTGTQPTQNYTFPNINANAVVARIGTQSTGVNYLDGYLTEVNFIDGQALTPSSFGETDVVTGVWKPKKYAGTYGTNGFYLNFSDNSAATATAIGKDSSGNGNNWTPNNISVTAGVTYDSMLDTPTPYADGGNGRGNYCTLNPIFPSSGTTLSNANLDRSSTTGYSSIGTMAVSSGKWYWEATIGSSNGANNLIGIGAVSAGTTPQQWYTTANGWAYFGNTGNKFNNSSGSAYGATFTSGDVIGVALDCDNGTLTFYKNNTSQGTAFTGLNTGAIYAPIFDTNLTAATVTVTANFGQRPFSYTPPTGFKALNTQNLPDSTIKKGNAYFDATTYTGNGSSLTVTNSGSMQPDLLWYKDRPAVSDHRLFDSVRGVTKALYSDDTLAEATEASALTSFNSNGFTVGSGSGNTNTRSFIGWQWKKGATQGFDIVTYTGTGVARTISHALGVKPAMMIIKNRSGAYDWPTWHQNLPNPTTQHFWLNATNAAQVSGSFNSTQPTSSVFSVGTTSEANANGNNFVAYLFAEVAGFSKFGSYTGNGSTDGTFVYLGFRPRYVMVKRTDAINGNWEIFDSARSTYNVNVQRIFANDSSSELTGEAFDMLSNGFKCRLAGTSDSNTSGGTYIYAAFAENPFKNSLAR